jgi:hypothetical protein
MALHAWPNCPDPVHDQVGHLSATLSVVLGAQLVGIYLHGSLAMGCFNPGRSDLDLLVVTAERMSLTVKRQIVEYLLACSQQPQPLEISFLARAQLHPWRYPTPFDLHYSEMWRSAFTHDLASGTWPAGIADEHPDPDLAAHITLLHARGICIAGAPIATVFPPVPADDYRASIAGDIHDGLASIAANPVYTILNCCRTYAYLCEGCILSKAEGGRWALPVLPAGLCQPVAAALAAYRSEAADPGFDAAELNAFAAHMRRVLAPVIGASQTRPMNLA